MRKTLPLLKNILATTILVLTASNALAIKDGKFGKVSDFPSSMETTLNWSWNNEFQQIDGRCTATKISPNAVLSAAHCFRLLVPENSEGTMDFSTLFLGFAQSGMDGFSQGYKKIKTVYYNNDIDLAIMELADSSADESSLQLFSRIPSAKLNFEPLKNDDDVIISGYGYPIQKKGNRQKIKFSYSKFQDSGRHLSKLQKTPTDFKPPGRDFVDKETLISVMGVIKKSSNKPEGNGIMAPGDSGGAVYVKNENGLSIIGVNSSASLFKYVFLFPYQESYFIRLDQPIVQEWIASTRVLK